MQTFVAIAQTVAQIWQSLSKWRPSAILDFRNSKFCLPVGLRGSKCIIITNFMAIHQTVDELWQFNVFQNGGYPPSWIFETRIFNSGYGSEGHCAPFCKISWRSVKPFLRYGDFSIFQKWRPSTILDLLWACLDNPRTVFGGIYHCTEFSCNGCSSFNNMQVLIFNEFSLQMPIYLRPKMEVFGNYAP